VAGEEHIDHRTAGRNDALPNSPDITLRPHFAKCRPSK